MKHYALLMLLGLAGLGGAAGCTKDPPPRPVRPVRVMRVGDAAVFSPRGLPGRARATQEVNLSFRVSGPLISRAFDVGDEVEEGQILAQIDPRDFQVAVRNVEAELDRARANLRAMLAGARPEELEKLRAEVTRREADARRWQFEYERMVELQKQDSAADVEIEEAIRQRDTSAAALRTAREDLRIGETGARLENIDAKEAEIRSLEAAVDSARDQLAYTYLRAPFSGTVAAAYVENYETVARQQPVCRLLDSSRIEMVIDVPESGMSLESYITAVTCRFDVFPDIELAATIKEVGSEASETTRTYPVTLIMDQPENVKVLPGMAGTATPHVELPSDGSEAEFEIPGSAVFTGSDGARCVWLVDATNSTVKRTAIRPGQMTTRGLKVGGLSLGQTVVTAGVHYLRDGQVVRVWEPSLEEARP